MGMTFFSTRISYFFVIVIFLFGCSKIELAHENKADNDIIKLAEDDLSFVPVDLINNEKRKRTTNHILLNYRSYNVFKKEYSEHINIVSDKSSNLDLFFKITSKYSRLGPESELRIASTLSFDKKNSNIPIGSSIKINRINKSPQGLFASNVNTKRLELSAMLYIFTITYKTLFSTQYLNCYLTVNPYYKKTPFREYLIKDLESYLYDSNDDSLNSSTFNQPYIKVKNKR